MALLKFADYRPDVSDFESTSSRLVLNVIPQGDGYGPFPSFSSYTQSLPGACRGGYYALKNDGSVITFAATATRLYMLNNSSFTWTDVSKGGAAYTSLNPDAQWQFAQTGNFVFATQANVVLQVFDLTSSTIFGDALGSPPQAAYISVVGAFLVLSGLLSLPYRIMWSGLNSFNGAQSWTAGINSCDFQDFTDGGIVRGAAGGDQSGVIFQDQTIRSMAYVAGSPVIFQISKIATGTGLFAPYSKVSGPNGSVYYYAGQGFQRIDPGGVPTPIGRERVDRTLLANLDKANLQLFMAAADPRSSRIFWAYKSNAGSSGLYDAVLGYDPVLDRFFPVQMSGEFLFGVSQSGITLASLDPIAPTPLTVTAAANNGSGLIRLTLSAESNSDFSILGQNFIEVYGVTGTALGTSNDANGTWNFNVIDGTHIDLIGSIYNGAKTYIGGQIGGSLAAMTLSLDDYATAVQPQLGQFDDTHMLGFFSGAPLQATIQTGEQSGDAGRLEVSGFRPITDSANILGSIFYRETQQATPVQSAETRLSRVGRCDMVRDATYVRFQLRIPAGDTWTFASGIIPDVAQGGMI